MPVHLSDNEEASDNLAHLLHGQGARRHPRRRVRVDGRGVDGRTLPQVLASARLLQATSDAVRRRAYDTLLQMLQSHVWSHVASRLSSQVIHDDRKNVLGEEKYHLHN